MKTENTPENKAAFFAQHWGQEIAIETYTGFIASVSDAIRRSWIDGYHLELTPQSLINDEDAEFIIGKSECRYITENRDNTGFGMSPSGIFVDRMYGLSYEGLSDKDVDYLRYKGYAANWRDLSVSDLVEYGWIKLKE